MFNICSDLGSYMIKAYIYSVRPLNIFLTLVMCSAFALHEWVCFTGSQQKRNVGKRKKFWKKKVKYTV